MFWLIDSDVLRRSTGNQKTYRVAWRDESDQRWNRVEEATHWWRGTDRPGSNHNHCESSYKEYSLSSFNPDFPDFPSGPKEKLIINCRAKPHVANNSPSGPLVVWLWFITKKINRRNTCHPRRTHRGRSRLLSRLPENERITCENLRNSSFKIIIMSQSHTNI